MLIPILIAIFRHVIAKSLLNKREANMYRHISNVYGNENLRDRRKNDFYRKVLEIQLDRLREIHEEYRNIQNKKYESKMHQKQVLKRLRDKFDDDQVKRFRTQYVTSRVLEHEGVDRHEYGLPENINLEAQYRYKLKAHFTKPDN